MDVKVRFKRETRRHLGDFANFPPIDQHTLSRNDRSS